MALRACSPVRPNPIARSVTESVSNDRVQILVVECERRAAHPRLCVCANLLVVFDVAVGNRSGSWWAVAVHVEVAACACPVPGGRGVARGSSGRRFSAVEKHKRSNASALRSRRRILIFLPRAHGAPAGPGGTPARGGATGDWAATERRPAARAHPAAERVAVCCACTHPRSGVPAPRRDLATRVH